MTAAGETLTCKSLQDYMKTLPKSTLEQLYKHPATCLAVFRELPELSKQFILRLLFVTQPVSQVLVALWIPQIESGIQRSDVALEHKTACQALADMSIWEEVTDHRQNPAYQLSRVFASNLKVAMFGGGSPWTMTKNFEPDPYQRDIEFLDKYALERWETVLQFLVRPHEKDKEKETLGISLVAIRTLLHAGLIESKGDGPNMRITSSGFQFLLLDAASQVWYFLLKYLETVTERGLSLVSCLSFLFKLSFSTLGKDYSMEGLDSEMLTFLQHLREFGLVYQRKRSSGRFYPTHLALNITAGHKKGSVSPTRQGCLIIETNYRIYAYTTSELQISLLSIFCDIECRFPNLVVSSITRQSIRRALTNGIGAEQIISFLKQHCHPQMYKQNPVIPRTVADQEVLSAVQHLCSVSV
ncbi:general transcription factor IIH subunit 4 marionette isoform X2 [Oratosquilla oratoria]|uniref:general transcription factor IIH subunit 4 marionette isoform X2 n=1 Tax=Oratosquilla oratoria TaxID=337810 RepID=UPI003F77505F